LTVNLHISSHDGVPIYLQIVNQVKFLLASGRLAAGEEIPPIRVLAEQLVVNPNTVARAYLELERAGIVVKRQGSGTSIAETAPPLARRDRIRLLGPRLDALVAEARQLDLTNDELVKMVQQRYAQMDKETSTL
jgi:GntR family transcriptional regulator